jgi:hypothetical protein
MRYLIVLVAACSSTDPKPAEKSIESKPFHLTFGEATVYELGNPETAVFKLHGDGGIELLWKTKSKQEWIKGPVVHADGTISPNVKITEHEVVEPPSHNGNHVKIDGNALVIHTDGLDDVTVSFADNKITMAGHRKQLDKSWRIEAKDPEVAHTAFLLFGAEIPPMID